MTQIIMKNFVWIFLSLLFALILHSCTGSAENEKKSYIFPNKDKDIASFKGPEDPWLTYLCPQKQFSVFPQCSEPNPYRQYYLIRLSMDFFKEFVYIGIIIDNNEIKDIFVAQFFITSSINNKLLKKYGHVLEYPYPVFSNDPYYLYYKYPKRVNFDLGKKSQKNLVGFFEQTVWSLEKNVTEQRLDPEVWRVDAFKDGEERSVIRNSGQDSVFYENIQNILNICNVTSYKYTSNVKK